MDDSIAEDARSVARRGVEAPGGRSHDEGPQQRRQQRHAERTHAPRQRQRPMNELLSNAGGNPELDHMGSLVDADMGAYYTWLNQQRLPGAEQSRFIAWFEGHNEALAIGPSLQAGTETSTPTALRDILAKVV